MVTPTIQIADIGVLAGSSNISPSRAQCALRARARLWGSIASPAAAAARTREWGHQNSHYAGVPRNILEKVKEREALLKK
jgi:hypothetical protein